MRLSVIIPVYNGGKYLSVCIDSVLRCEAETEIIVVNDGSTDETEAICLSYGEAIVYLKQENAGVSSARNAGIAAASGDYLLFLDADDVLVSETLTAALMEQIAQQNADVYAFGYDESDEKLRIKRRERYAPRTLEGKAHIMPLGAYHSAFLVKRSLVTAHGLRYPDCALCEDSIFKYGFLYFSGDTRVMAPPLFIYRRHAAGASKRNNGVFSVYNGAVNAWYALMQNPDYAENNKAHRRYCLRRMVSTLCDMVMQLLAFSGEEDCLAAVAKLDAKDYLQQQLSRIKTPNRKVQLVQAALQQKSGVRRLAYADIIKLRLKNLIQ